MRGDLAKTVCLDGKKLKKNVSATSWVWVQSSSKREFLPYTHVVKFHSQFMPFLS